MDRIFLRGFEVKAIIGIWDWERRMPQKIVIDLEMGVDSRPAGRSDRIEDTVNYKAVADGVAEIAVEGQFQLVEALAEAIATYVLDDYPTDWVSVRVSKPGAIKGSRDVGVYIERSSASAT